MSQPDNRSVRQIEEQIEASRDQLARTIDELVVRTKPANILAAQKASAMNQVRAFATTPEGDLKIERIAAVGAVVLGLLALSIYRRTR